jgi:hypothetical protein
VNELCLRKALVTIVHSIPRNFRSGDDAFLTREQL